MSGGGRSVTPVWTHESCNRSGWIGPGEPCPICEQEARERMAKIKTGNFGINRGR